MKLRNRSNSVDMLHGPLLKKILLFSLPLVLSGMLQQLFNSADIAVVGRFAGSAAQAAVGCNTSVVALMLGLFTGLSVGANAEIAACIGREDDRAIDDAVHTVILLAFLSGIFMLFLGLFIARPLLRLMNTPDDVLQQAVLYLRVYMLGAPFIILYNFGAAILRSKGDTARPTAALIIAGVINLGLNLVFVIVFHMGVAGVAVATTISNLFSGTVILILLLREEGPFRLSLNRLRLVKQPLVQVVRIGVPAGIQTMVFSLSNVCIQSAVNSLGSVIVAGSADGVTFEMYSYYLISGFVQTTVTFTGQNYAAGHYDRCRRILWLCMASSAVSTLAAGLTLYALRIPFMHLFTTDEAVIAAAIVRFKHVLILQFIANSYEISASALRGIGVALPPAIISILGTCLLRILWVYTVFPHVRSFAFLLYIYPISWVVTGCSMLTALALAWKKNMPRQKELT